MPPALGTRSIKTTSKAWAIDTAISMIDLTTLEGADTPGKVRGLAAKALVPDPSDLTTPRPAAVCVYGDMVATAKEALGSSGVKVAAVATAFPSGRASLPVKLADIADAVKAGADEIDMVIDRGAFLAGDYLTVFHQIAEVKAICGSARLKVIMETGELVTYDNVRRASWLSMLAGGDFIKTSTGKVSPAATLPVTLIMLEAVRDWRETTGEMVGVKPAGGIRTSKDAIKFLVSVNEVAGEEWLDNHWFRFGASSLLNDLHPAAPADEHRRLLRRRLRRRRLPQPLLTGRDEPTDRGTRTMSPFEYAPAPESRAVVDIASSYGLFIGGEFVEATGGTPFKTVNPATEEVLAEVSEASADDVDAAVRAARTAYTRVWSRMSGADRGKYLFRIARILQERAREFAVLETLDNGKPIKEARDVDLPLAAAHFFYHAGWADKLDHASLGPDPRPLGVVGQVVPWNFPLLMLAWKIAPALACGNTVVLKPAETTPLTALLFADVCRRPTCPRASSTSSPAPAPRGRRSSTTPASTSSRSPARPPSAR